MPPVWFVFAASAAIVLMSAWRTMAMARLYNLHAFSFAKGRVEEEALRETHGDAYDIYARNVGRWFGRRGGAPA